MAVEGAGQTLRRGERNDGSQESSEAYLGVDPLIVQDRPQSERRMPTHLKQFEVPSMRTWHGRCHF